MGETEPLPLLSIDQKRYGERKRAVERGGGTGEEESETARLQHCAGWNLQTTLPDIGWESWEPA